MNGKGLELNLLSVDVIFGRTSEDCAGIVLGGGILEGGGGSGQACRWINLHAGGDDHRCKGEESADNNHTAHNEQRTAALWSFYLLQFQLYMKNLLFSSAF